MARNVSCATAFNDFHSRVTQCRLPHPCTSESMMHGHSSHYENSFDIMRGRSTSIHDLQLSRTEITAMKCWQSQMRSTVRGTISSTWHYQVTTSHVSLYQYSRAGIEGVYSTQNKRLGMLQILRNQSGTSSKYFCWGRTCDTLLEDLSKGLRKYWHFGGISKSAKYITLGYGEFLCSSDLEEKVPSMPVQ